MKRVHEETWEVDKCCADCTDVSLTEGGFAVASMGATIDDPEWQVARARLAAQAPAMARLLLAVQWKGGDPAVGNECVSCFGDSVMGHQPDCAFVTVLRAAGVIE